MWITVCLGLICVLLVVALIMMYNHLRAERDRMKKKVEEKSTALNSLNIKCDRLSDERDELEEHLKSLKVELKTNYSLWTDERDELEKNLKSVNQVKLDLEKNLTNAKQKKLELEAELEKRDCQKGKNIKV